MRNNSWNSVVLRDVATFASGKTPSRSRQSDYFDAGTIPWVKTMDLTNAEVLRTDECITERAILEARLKVLPVGAVLVAMYGGFSQIGRTGVLRVPAATNQAITAVLPNSARLNSDYLLHFLNHNIHYWRTVASSSRKDPNITKADVKALPLTLPPLREQGVIADALNDVDSLITTLERMIAKKQAIKQGMMQQLLTGKTRLPGFTDPWQPRRLGDMLGYEQPGRYLVQTPRQLVVGRVPVLTAGKTFILGFTNETHGIYTAHPVIIFDDFTTASQYVDFDFKAKSSAMKILSAKPGVGLRFLYERMQLIDFPLGDHKRYWISEYSKQEIEVPNEAEQRAISAVIVDADRAISLLRDRLSKARDVKQGMMQQLLTGRTRLPVKEGA